MSYPNLHESENRWYSLPEKTTVTKDWTVLVLDNGYKILTFGDEFAAGAQVHVVGPDDREIAMWECVEWGDEPESVMGAILRAAGGA